MHHFIYLCFFFIANLLRLSYVSALTEIPQEHRHMIEHHPYRILGVGAACMDLLIPVSEDFLAHVPGEKGGAQPIGIEKLNQIISQSEVMPKLATGGSCANTIKGLASLDEKCAFLSNIGSDALGEHFTQYMKKLGIVALFSKSSHPTPRVLCLITPDGQRTMRFCAGCSVEMSDHFLHPDYFKKVKLVHLDAYTLRNGNLTRRVMQLAKEAHAKVSIDLSSFEIIRDYHATLLEILPLYVDIVFANEDETRALTGLGALEGCLKLQEICPVAVTLMGKEGCLVGHKGEVFHSPGFPAQLVDSTGAGDLFASGFLYGYLQGYSLPKCARLGNRFGSAIVEVQGAELPAEKWKGIQASLLEDPIFQSL
jgi:sugar/nucleoside kinase (ribokinase family)